MAAVQNASTISSNSSAKDDAATETEPDQPSGYGTRSRRSGATRPNYNDNEYDSIEDQLLMPVKMVDEPSSSKRSTPSDSTSKARPTTEAGSGPAGPTRLRLNLSSHASSAGTLAAQETQSTPSHASAPAESRKKRKYAKQAEKAGGSPAATIPGSYTTSFFASPSASDATATAAPAAKKRKTGDNIQPVTAGSSPGVSSARKASVQSPRYGPRESQVVTFDKSKYLLNKDGQLEGDDGLLYAPEGMCSPPPFASLAGPTPPSICRVGPERGSSPFRPVGSRTNDRQITCI